MAKYQWLDGGPAPVVEADVFGKIVEKLAASADIKAVKPALIVDAAKAASSPIHKLFNWDDDKAADLYRRDQARKYLQRLQIVRVHVTEGQSLSSRAFYSVDTGGARAYASRERVLSDSDLKKQIIDGARKELESYLNKYAGIAALGQYVPRLQSVIDDMRDELDQLALDATRRRPATQEHSPSTAPAIPAE